MGTETGPLDHAAGLKNGRLVLHGERRSVFQWWISGVIPAIVIGCFIAIFVNAIRDKLDFPETIIAGALIGICSHSVVLVFEILLNAPMARLSPVGSRVARGFMYAVAGTIGFFIGFILALTLVYNVPLRGIFGSIDFRPLLTIAAVLAVIIGLGSYTYHELRRKLEVSIETIKENEYAEKELELAREIQSRLLPPPDSEGPGYRIAARNLAARYVAGDFYDVFHLSDGSVGLVVADVAGKGMGASLIMATVKAVLPLLAAGRSAAETLTELNAKLSKELGRREFVALAYIRFNPSSGSLELANGGLPDPYLIHGSDKPLGLSPPGPRLPLGVKKDVHYQALNLTLDHGDRVVMFSDGLAEATIGPDEPLGYEALAATFALNDGQPPSQWLDGVFATLRARTAPVLEDDWTALVVERI